MVSSISRFFPYSIWLFLLVILQHSQGQPSTTKTLHTRHGTLTIKIVGDITIKGKTPVVALPGAAAELRDEWLPLTTLLAKDMNCVCVLVYLDSMAKPWVVKDIVDILSVQVLLNTFHAEKAIFLGKSFGGLLAQEFVLQYPQQAISLVLFAPAGGNHDHIERLCKHTAVPLFLGWTADDPSYLHHSKFTRSCTQKDFVFHSELYGGHAITQEYYEQVTQFLTLYKPQRSP